MFPVLKLEQDGYAIHRSVLTPTEIASLGHAIQSSNNADDSAGIRSLANKVKDVRLLAESPTVRSLIEPVIGKNARLVRSILFNKSQATNWQVAWHQDLSIAVESKVEMPGFDSWSVKEGVHHVQPPFEILERMITVRVHLDAADDTNGALWVAPGSHRMGRIPAGEAAGVADRMGKELCAVNAGDAMLFRPLLLHASRKATSTKPRRVVHLEFVGVDLPKPLEWATNV